MKDKNKFFLRLTVIFTTLCIVFIPMVSGLEDSQVSVRIKNPDNGGIVEKYFVDVYGTSSGLENSNLNLYILVHPISTESYWVQTPPSTDRDGSWMTRIYVGLKDIGNNEDYSIKAIITNEKLEAGEKYHVNELPSSIAEDQIKVTRKDKTIISIIFSATGLAVIGILVAIILGVFTIRRYR